jgi:hypothetical protein
MNISARLDHDDLRLPLPGCLLHERGGDRVIVGRVRPRDESDLGVLHVAEHVGNRARPDPLEKCGH